MTKKKTYKDPHANREAERYANPIPSRELILQVLEDQGRPLAEKELIKLLKVRGEESREAFGFRLRAMLRDGQLLENRAGCLGLVERMNLIAGRVEVHKGDFGFVIPDAGGPDLFLPPRQLQKVMDGDRVLASERSHSITGRKEGQIIEVTQRALTELVGRFRREGSTCWLLPENKRLRHEALISDLGGLHPDEGDHVRAVIEQYPNADRAMRVRLVEVIASPNDPGMEIEVALRNFDLPFVWPNAVIKQLSGIPDKVSMKDIRGRHDLRDLPLVTIDGEDARDFDDAVHVTKRPNGGWRLIVAIADVSYYVHPASALDQEAHLRGTSVYFPSRVIPMLPEKLSNGICSLNPDVDRLCLYCDMVVSAKGTITGHVFREGIMRSHKRFTYTQVAAFLEQPDSALAQELQESLSESLKQQLHDFHQLFHALRAQREERGAIDFESNETRVLFDENLKIRAIVPQTRNVAHTMIEEAMLAANVCAAKLLHKQKLPALYRNHEGPKQEKLASLQQFLAPLGLSLNWDGESKPTPDLFQQLSASLAGRPDRALIQLVMLRTLNQARYEAENKGHFGLAYTCYTHFTSPIRRYPDLLVHRALRYLIRQGNCKEVDNSGHLPTIERNAILPFNEARMVELGEHCSMTERRADDASRDVMQWLKCQFMERHLGSTFHGTISGVTGFGLFVEIDDLRIDGLIHIATLGNDYYRFDPHLHLLKGEATGYRFRLGDRVEVQLAAVITEERKIDLQLVSHQSGGKISKKPRDATPSRQKKGKTANSGKRNNKTGKGKATDQKARKGPPRGRKAARRRTSR
jgi:ribonuclease R